MGLNEIISRWLWGKHGENPEAKKKWPKGQELEPVYKSGVLMMDPEGDVMTRIFRLICPVCETRVTRSDFYCPECGNRLKTLEGIEPKSRYKDGWGMMEDPAEKVEASVKLP